MAGTSSEPSKTNHGEITLDLSAAGRSGGSRDKEMTKKDKRTGRQTGRGGGWGKRELGRGRPWQARSPCTLLSYEGGSIRVAQGRLGSNPRGQVVCRNV